MYFFQELLTGNLVRQLYWRKSSLRLQRLPISLGRVVSLLLDKFSEIWTTERHLHHSDSSGIQTKNRYAWLQVVQWPTCIILCSIWWLYLRVVVLWMKHLEGIFSNVHSCRNRYTNQSQLWFKSHTETKLWKDRGGMRENLYLRSNSIYAWCMAASTLARAAWYPVPWTLHTEFLLSRQQEAQQL